MEASIQAVLSLSFVALTILQHQYALHQIALETETETILI